MKKILITILILLTISAASAFSAPLTAPSLSSTYTTTYTGYFRVMWTNTNTPSYEVQSSTTQTFDKPKSTVLSKLLADVVYTPAGVYYYRVRSVSGKTYSAWSNVIKVTVTDKPAYTRPAQVKRLVMITDSAGRKYSLSYTAKGKVQKITDPIKRQLEFFYDTKGMLIKSRDPRGNDRTYEYQRNILTAHTTRTGGRYEYSYSYNRRALKQIDPLGNKAIFDYLWDTTWVTNSLGQTEYYTFDQNNNLWKHIDLMGNTELPGYDINNNLMWYTDCNSNAIRL